MGEPGCKVGGDRNLNTNHFELQKRPALVQRQNQRPVKSRAHVPTTERYADFGLLVRPLVQRTSAETPTSNDNDQQRTTRNQSG